MLCVERCGMYQEHCASRWFCVFCLSIRFSVCLCLCISDSSASVPVSVTVCFNRCGTFASFHFMLHVFVWIDWFLCWGCWKIVKVYEFQSIFLLVHLHAWTMMSDLWLFWYQSSSTVVVAMESTLYFLLLFKKRSFVLFFCINWIDHVSFGILMYDTASCPNMTVAYFQDHKLHTHSE